MIFGGEKLLERSERIVRRLGGEGGMCYDRERERDYLDIPISKMDQRGIEVSVPQAGRER